MAEKAASPLKNTPRLPRGYLVSLSAVEVCLLNAERLLLDATKTSGPTAAALAELSVEEAAKAWMLYFRLLFQGRRPRFSPRLSRTGNAEIDEFLESQASYLRGLDNEIAAAFRFHKVKLRFLSFLLLYVEKVLPVLGKKGNLKRLAEEIHGPTIRISESAGGLNTENALRLLKAFRLERLTELDAVKQRGFYVGLTKRGDLVSPDIDPVPSQLLLQLGAFLILTLKGDLIALTK